MTDVMEKLRFDRVKGIREGKASAYFPSRFDRIHLSNVS